MLVELIGRLPPRVPERLRTARPRLDALGLPRLRWFAKARTLRAYGAGAGQRRLLAAKYVLLDPELDNFTYDLANEEELLEFVADVTAARREEIGSYLAETRVDPELNERVRERLRARKDRKRTPRFGRRLGWYAIARRLKPPLIVETGIHDGLGSLLLLRALERNASDGRPGRLISIDVNPDAGWLVPEHLRERWRPVYGSTFDVLEPAVDGAEVGMIVHDSDHTYDCELFEFTTAVEHAAPILALVSDNAHATSALRDVCASLGIEYHFFRERPSGHFYPGAGIGFALLRRQRDTA